MLAVGGYFRGGGSRVCDAFVFDILALKNHRESVHGSKLYKVSGLKPLHLAWFMAQGPQYVMSSKLPRDGINQSGDITPGG